MQPQQRVGNTEEHAPAAFDGTRYLVVPADDRAGTRDIFAVRLSSDGSLIGEAFPVTQVLSDDADPDVVYDGTTRRATRPSTRRALVDLHEQ